MCVDVFVTSGAALATVDFVNEKFENYFMFPSLFLDELRDREWMLVVYPRLCIMWIK